MSPIVFSIHIVALAMCVILPIAMTISIARNRSKLDQREYKVKWGTLYNGIRTSRNSSSQYSSVFLWRRLFYVLIVVLLYKFDYFRIQIFIITQTLFLIFLGFARAHSYNLYNGIDLFNEYMILWAGYYMIINTDYMPDLAVRYWLGWTAVIIYIAVFLINLLIVVVIFISELKHAVKMHRLKKQFTVQYSRKELMESNYFKSGRDTGPKSTKMRLTKQSQSRSERDSSPMSRRDRIRRKRALARDRSDQSSDTLSNHSQNLKTFSKMMK